MAQDYLERKVEDHDKRLNEIEKNSVEISVIVKQFVKSIEDFSTTMKNMEKTLVEIQYSLKTHSENIQTLDSKMDKLDEKVDSELEKNKIDVLEPIRAESKNNLVNKKTVVGAGAIVALIEIVRQVFENWPKK